MVPDTRHFFFLLIHLKVHPDHFEYEKMDKLHTLLHTTEDKHTTME